MCKKSIVISVTCGHLILRELIDMFLVQNPQYRYNVEETNA